MYRLVLLLFLSAASAQLEVAGPCNFTNIQHQVQFSQEVTGNWYQIARIPNDVESGQCSQSRFRVTTSVVVEGNVTGEQSLDKYDSEVVAGKLVLRNGTITNVTESGVLEITYGDVSRNYVVLGTDNTNYLVLYSCRDSGSRSIISAWKFGRNTTYSDSAANATRLLTDAANITNTNWIEVSHSEAACKINNSGFNVQMSPVILLVTLLVGLAKEF